MNEIELVKLLLTMLPDSNNGEDWDWCWEELYSESQDRVQEVRQMAEKLL